MDSGNFPYILIAVGFFGGVVDNEFQIYCLMLLFFGIVLVMIQDFNNERPLRTVESTDTLVSE